MVFKTVLCKLQFFIMQIMMADIVYSLLRAIIGYSESITGFITLKSMPVCLLIHCLYYLHSSNF